MDLSTVELRILRAAAHAPGGRIFHFDMRLDGVPFVMVNGERINLESFETIQVLIGLGLLEPEFGRSVAITDLGRAVAEVAS